MKIKKDEVNLLTSEKDSSSINFGIGDTGVIIDLLRKRLYSHPLRTMVQEYLSNGRDATREAKSSTPLEVTLPTKIDPVFKVRDFGPGLSPERVRNVFVLYGSSTKRTDNTQTGGFGIGAKSAWAYTDSFTIVSVYNGLKSSYIAHLGKNSEGSLDLLEQEPTQEPSGVEISIAIQHKDISAVLSAAFRTTRFWTQKPVFKGILEVEMPEEYVQPLFLEEKNFSVGKNVLSWHNIESTNKKNSSVAKNSRKREGQNFWAIVDGIPYEVTKAVNDNQRSQLNKSQIYLYFQTGDLQINANREEVVFDETVSPLVQKRIQEVIDTVKFKNQKYLESCKDLEDVRVHMETHKELLSLLTGKAQFKLNLSGSDFRVMKDSDDFTFSFPNDQLSNASLQTFSNFQLHDFKRIIFLKETFDAKKWKEFIQRSDKMKKDMNFLITGVIFVKTENKAPYLRWELAEDRQKNIRTLFDTFFKEEKEREKERIRANEERERKKKETEEWKKKWGYIYKIGYSYHGLIKDVVNITYDFEKECKKSKAKFLYFVNERPQNPSGVTADFYKKLFFSSKDHGYSIIVTDKAREKEVKALGIPEAESVFKTLDFSIPNKLKEDLIQHFRVHKVPSCFKHMDDQFLESVKDCFSTEELELVKIYRSDLENKPYVDMNYAKLFFNEEFAVATKKAKDEKTKLNQWCSKYGFLTCINFKSNNWKTEAARFLKLVAKEKEQEDKKK